MSESKTFMDYISDAKRKIKEVDIETADEMITTGVKVLDIRESHEYINCRIRDAINIPRGVLEAAADPTFPGSNPALREAQEDKWLVVCATGGRSALAANTLQEMGFTDVKSIAGGLTAWKEAGKEVHSDTDTSFDK